MAGFGGIQHGGDARRAHLALVEGGASASASTALSARAGSSAIGTDPVLRAAATAARATTGYSAARATEGPRGSHEGGVRAVAKRFERFDDDALFAMVLASGVGGEAAGAVADAINANPALRAQAERAFQRARIDAVS